MQSPYTGESTARYRPGELFWQRSTLGSVSKLPGFNRERAYTRAVAPLLLSHDSGRENSSGNDRRWSRFPNCQGSTRRELAPERWLVSFSAIDPCWRKGSSAGALHRDLTGVKELTLTGSLLFVPSIIRWGWHPPPGW